jgi:two-component system LytT family sensor kinase
VTGSYTTLTDELSNVERYVALERSRLGARLIVRLRIAPEVLSVVLPYLALQQLVENAVRNGLSGRPNGGTVELVAENSGAECVITVEDDGVGLDPSRLGGRPDDGDLSGPIAVLSDVDDRMRAAFGDDFGLVVDTNVGMGMKVTVRVPKFRAGVLA